MSSSCECNDIESYSDSSESDSEYTYEECKKLVPQDLAKAACVDNLYYPADLHEISHKWDHFIPHKNIQNIKLWSPSQVHNILFLDEYNIDLTLEHLSKWIDYIYNHPYYYKLCKYVLHNRYNASNIWKMGKFRKLFSTLDEYNNFIIDNLYRTCTELDVCNDCNLFCRYIKMLPPISYEKWEMITEKLITNRITTLNMMYWLYYQSTTWDSNKGFKFNFITDDLSHNQLAWIDKLLTVIQHFNANICKNKQFTLMKTVLSRMLQKNINYIQHIYYVDL